VCDATGVVEHKSTQSATQAVEGVVSIMRSLEQNTKLPNPNQGSHDPITVAQDLQTDVSTEGGLCQDGEHPMPVQGYTPSQNGCGSANAFFLQSVAKNFFIGQKCLDEFRSCCNHHDVCYGTCNKAKETCDRNLVSCVKRVSSPRCREKTDRVRLAVEQFGGSAFMSAQRDACVCTKKEPFLSASPNPM